MKHGILFLKKMPKCCSICPCADNVDDKYYCGVMAIDTGAYSGTECAESDRRSDCPIKEVDCTIK